MFGLELEERMRYGREWEQSFASCAIRGNGIELELSKPHIVHKTIELPYTTVDAINNRPTASGRYIRKRLWSTANLFIFLGQMESQSKKDAGTITLDDDRLNLEAYENNALFVFKDAIILLDFAPEPYTRGYAWNNRHIRGEKDVYLAIYTGCYDFGKLF